MEGWIKIHRKILENPIVCKDSEHYAVWNYLLLNATQKQIDVIFQGKRITLNPGQLITGRKVIAKQFNIDENKVQRILKMFEKQHQIEQQMSSQNRLITIQNWEQYQVERHQVEQQVNSNCTASEQQVNTNKNVKNVIMKECKNVVVEEVKEEIDSCVDGFQKVIDFYNNNIGLITPFAYEVLQDYAKEMDLEVIIYALEKSVSANARNLNFIKAILNNWSKQGIKTLIQAKDEEQKFKNNKNNIHLSDNRIIIKDYLICFLLCQNRFLLIIYYEKKYY